MPNSTAEYTDVDGVSLQTLTQNLTSWGGAREGVPPMRGDDQKIPYLPGRRFVRKIPDSRTITLEGWVLGVDAATGKVSPQAAKNNWRALKKLLWNPRRQVALTKRWYDAQGVLQTATALAQFTGGLEPDVMGGGTSLKYEVDMFLADPFFYGAEVTATLITGTQNVTILGDWPSLDGRLELVGAQGPTTVALNGTYAHQVTYGLAVAAGKTVTLDVLNFKATETGGVARTANVTHSGARFWFAAEPGVSSITVTRTGTGVLRYVYQPAWL